jgi:hypothetical protein
VPQMDSRRHRATVHCLPALLEIYLSIYITCSLYDFVLIFSIFICLFYSFLHLFRFILCWLAFPQDAQARYWAAVVPGLITLRFALLGLVLARSAQHATRALLSTFPRVVRACWQGVLKDEKTVRSLSRTGDRTELLKGPLIYGSAPETGGPREASEPPTYETCVSCVCRVVSLVVSCRVVGRVVSCRWSCRVVSCRVV